MAEEVLFEFERRPDRDEIAAYLRTAADNLESGDPMTLSAGEESVTMSPPDRPTFEIKAERESSSSGSPDELSVEFELEWREGDEKSTDGELQIE